MACGGSYVVLDLTFLRIGSKNITTSETCKLLTSFWCKLLSYGVVLTKRTKVEMI